MVCHDPLMHCCSCMAMAVPMPPPVTVRVITWPGLTVVADRCNTNPADGSDPIEPTVLSRRAITIADDDPCSVQDNVALSVVNSIKNPAVGRRIKVEIA